MLKIADLEEQLDKINLSLACVNEQLRTSQDNSDRKLEDSRIEHNRELNEVKKEALEREQNMADRHENALREARAALDATIFDLKKDNDTLKNTNEFLNHAKIDNESIIKELSQRVEGLERQNTSNNNELIELRDTVALLTKEKHTTELKLAEAVVNVDSAHKQLKEKDNAVCEAHKLSQHKETENNMIQERFREMQSDKNKLEEKLNSSVSEINKGNDIISKLQKELLSSKSKAEK